MKGGPQRNRSTIFCISLPLRALTRPLAVLARPLQRRLDQGGSLIESKQPASDTGRMTTIRKRRLSPQPRRTLELLKLLGSSPHGATEALLVRVHGFDSDMVGGLVRAELATAERETMKAGVKPVEVVRLRITAAGRKTIEE